MSSALLDHLWQSTLFAIGAWLLTLALRENGAHLRHGVWMVASIKFLVPISWLTMLGQSAQPWGRIGSADVAALVTDTVPALLGAVSSASCGRF